MTALPAALQQAFQQLVPLTNLLWYTDQQGIPCCLIKVPREVLFSDLLITLYTPRELYQPLRTEHSQERARIALQYSIQKAAGQPHINQTHIFHPSSFQEWHLLTRLAQASYLQLIGYSSDPAPQYLGSQRLAWSKSKRRTLRQWLAKYLPESLRSALATQHNETHTPQVEFTHWTLPANNRKSMASPLMRALITMPEQTTDALPRIYIKVPQGTRFDEVAVAFGPLNLMRYSVGWVFSLSLRLQDATGRILEADALGDPISDRHILHKLASVPSVEMVALADSSSFPVLGAKLLNWSLQKQKRAQSLFGYTRVAKLSGSWKRARISYLYEHPQGYIFQEPLPDTVGQRDVEVGTAREDDQLPMPHHEKTVSPEPLQVEKSEIPHSTEATSETAPTKHASDVSSLVDQFILLHRAGVHAEYHHTHTLSRGIFWRLLLAIALEQTQRKFIWTPEAVRMIESRRQQLTPSETLPWLSSREHLWIAFAEPIETPVCAETAALFVFSSSAPSLLSEFAQQVQMSSRALKALERTLYTPEKQRVIFNIINRAGAIVWAISLRTDAHIRLDDAGATWSATAWYTCPRLQCHLHNAEIDTLCDTCTAARTFTWTWLFAAWQSLQGLYRDKPVTDRFLETVGIEQSEHVSRISQEPDGKGVVGRADLTYRYQVVREIDIASAPPPTEPKSRSQRGSWVEMLSSIEPSLVFYDKREIPLRTRTLKHPRYARYIAQTGTNQVEVRPHTRHVPMRSNPKGMTQVTAKHYRKDGAKE